MLRILRFFTVAIALLATGATECHADRSTGKSNNYRAFFDEKEVPSEMEAATPGEFPFFVQWGGCAATLIWEDVLLTSAACDVLQSDEVLVGTYVSMKEEQGAVKRQIVERRSHPNFDPATFVNNFMVLKLNESVDTVPTVTIAQDVEIPEESELAVAGYGSTAARIQISKVDSELFQHHVIDTSEILRYGNDDGPVMRMNDAVLQKDRVALVSYEECNSDSQFAGFIDNNTMICAGNRYDGSDICFGDSGSPLCLMEGGQCTQIGIVSFGTTCAIRDRAAVYSRVSSAYEWIQSQICILSNSPPADCPSPSPTQQPTLTAAPSLPEVHNQYLDPSIVSIDEIAGRKSSVLPSDAPSVIRSDQPSDVTSIYETMHPTLFEAPSSSISSSEPSKAPSSRPSSVTNTFPSDMPSNSPSMDPANSPFDISGLESDVISPTSTPLSLPTPRPSQFPPKIASEPPHRTNVRTEEASRQDPISSATPTPGPTMDNKDRLFMLPRYEAEGKGISMTTSQTQRDPKTPSENPSVAPFMIMYSLADQSETYSLTAHMSTTEDDQPPVTRRRLQEHHRQRLDESEGINLRSTQLSDGVDGSESRSLQSSPWISSDGLLPDGLHLFLWAKNPPSQLLGPCEGDCDTDADCGNGMYCFSKPDGVAMEVPGCIGIDSSGTDFCTFKNLNLGLNPKPDGVNLYTWDKNPPNQLLGPCEGDCDDDSDCEPGLYCFPKGMGQVVDVPGCAGMDTSNTDFCVWKPTAQPTPVPTPHPTAKPTFLPTPLPTAIPPMKPPSSSGPPLLHPELFVYPENPPLKSNLPLQLCQGDCDDDSDCAEGLICYMRKEHEHTIPWCSGLTYSKTEFCTYPEGSRPPTSKPTRAPTPSPSPSPTFPPTKRPTLRPSPAPAQAPVVGPTKRPTKRPTTRPTVRPTPQPTSGPTGQEISITLAIYFDPWPEELSWSIETMQGEVISNVPSGTYLSDMDQVRERITVHEGATYRLTIQDSAADGIAGIGNLFEISLSQRPDIVLLQGDGVFAAQHVEMFYVPTQQEYPTSAPTLSPAPTFDSLVAVFLTIVFDNWHQETAWQIVARENPNQVWSEAVYDTYRAGSSVTERIMLPPGRSYIFIIKDFFEDGIDGGSYKMMKANGNVLFEGDGNFGAERSHQFTL